MNTKIDALKKLLTLKYIEKIFNDDKMNFINFIHNTFLQEPKNSYVIGRIKIDVMELIAKDLKETILDAININKKNHNIIEIYDLLMNHLVNSDNSDLVKKEVIKTIDILFENYLVLFFAKVMWLITQSYNLSDEKFIYDMLKKFMNTELIDSIEVIINVCGYENLKNKILQIIFENKNNTDDITQEIQEIQEMQNINIENEICQNTTMYHKWTLYGDISLRYFYHFKDNKKLEGKFVLKDHKTKTFDVISVKLAQALLDNYFVANRHYPKKEFIIGCKYPKTKEYRHYKIEED